MLIQFVEAAVVLMIFVLDLDMDMDTSGDQVPVASSTRVDSVGGTDVCTWNLSGEIAS